MSRGMSFLSNIGENIRSIRKNLKLTAEYVANILEIPCRTYQGYERNERAFPHDKLLKFAQKYGVSLDFIYTGKGEMFNSGNSDGDCVNIPIRGDVEASCGYGVVVHNESQTAVFNVSRKFLNDIGTSVSTSEIIFARGDSMEPTICHGDNLLVDTSKKDIYDGTLYCINLNGQIYAKRLQKISKDIIGLVPDNTKYEMIKVDISKGIDIFQIVGEIRWIGRIAK